MTILALKEITMNPSFFFQIALLRINLKEMNEILVEKVKESTTDHEVRLLEEKARSFISKFQNHFQVQHFLLSDL